MAVRRGIAVRFVRRQYGLKVALIEKSDKLGGDVPACGVCADQGDAVQRGDFRSLQGRRGCTASTVLGGGTINWPQVLKRKGDIINKHTAGLQYLVKKNKVTLVRGMGVLTGPSKDGVFSVAVDNEGKTSAVQAKKVVLATGSDARMIPGYTPDDKILTNIEILSLDKLPKSLVVIGSGAVGVEFASVFNSFNVPVTIIEMADRVVPAEDVEVSKEFARQYKKKGHHGSHVGKDGQDREDG